MRAHLDHATGLAGDLHHLSPLVDRLRKWFLAVHVLAGPAGHDRLQRVPMIGRGDQHRVDVRLIEDLAEVAVHGRLPAEQFGVGLFHRGPRDVTDRGDLAVGLLHEELHHLAASISRADHSEPHAIVTRTSTRACRERSHAERGGHTGRREGPS